MRQILSVYNITYRTFVTIDGSVEPRDEIIEVWAYSEEQAIFLAPCDLGQVLYVEKAVSKKAAYA